MTGAAAQCVRRLSLYVDVAATCDNCYYRNYNYHPPGMSDLVIFGSSTVQQASLDTDLLPLYLLRFDSVNTRRSYTNDVVQFFGSEVITLRVARTVSFVEINAHLEQMSEDGAKASSMQRRIAALRGFFSWLVALQLIEQNPADRQLVRRIPRVYRRDRVITVLSREEASQLLEAVDPESPSFVRNQTLLLVLLHCVLRRSEARAMDFEHLRKIDRYWVLDLPFTKGGADQYIKVPEHVAEAILALKQQYGYANGPVWRSFSGNSSGKRLSCTSIYSIVRETAECAGIVARVGAHTLRHTGCTLAIESGASLQQVQAHARHKNLETTMIYVHQRDRLSDSAADYIDLSGANSDE